MKPKAILVDVIDDETSKREAHTRLQELEYLVNTYGGIVVIKVIQRRGVPNYETYVGTGKLDEIIEIAKNEKASYLILNNILKPGQIYNISERVKEAGLEVWDRVDLILKIFGKHAESTEAKLQIQLASIQHMGPRIYGMGEELMQQTGARGLRGGAGETNVEVMKRHLRKQEQAILKKLKHYEVIHEGHRARRRRQNFKTIALVGYTNAGKSSILKALTGKDVYIADELFATLDTRIGKIYDHESKTEILMADTIGFIQDLPPDLIKAFKSTLSEAIESDLILHVIDVSDPMVHMKIEVVEDILKQLKADKKPKIYVFNKTDLVVEKVVDDNGKPPPRTSNILKAGEETAKRLGWLKEDQKAAGAQSVSTPALKKKYKKFDPIFVSVKNKENLDVLKKLLSKKVCSKYK